MTDTPSPFAPFQLPSPTIESPKPTETAKQKAAREKHEAKEAKVVVKKNAETDRAVVAQPDKLPRKTREKKTGLKVHSPKFELQAILAVASTLSESDFPLFEKLVMSFDEMGKPQRDRLLEAIGKVFD